MSANVKKEKDIEMEDSGVPVRLKVYFVMTYSIGIGYSLHTSLSFHIYNNQEYSIILFVTYLKNFY